MCNVYKYYIDLGVVIRLESLRAAKATKHLYSVYVGTYISTTIERVSLSRSTHLVNIYLGRWR